MRIVKFKDGRFGIRKGFFNYEFLGLRGVEDYWWGKYEFIEKYCKGTIEECKETLKMAKHDYGEL